MDVLQDLMKEQRDIFDIEDICFEDVELAEILKTNVGYALTSVRGQMKNTVRILFGCRRCIINCAVAVEVHRKG